jgi:HD-like signal output (HDOD) protein
LAARLLGRSLPSVDNNALFIAGLLHDIGQTLMCHVFPVIYPTMLERFAKDDALLVKAELFSFKFDHAELGSRCLAMWSLPETTASIVQQHHGDPTLLKPSDPIQRAVLVLMCAEQLVHYYDEGLRDQALVKATTDQSLFEQLSLSNNTIKLAVALMTEEFCSLAAFN